MTLREQFEKEMKESGFVDAGGFDENYIEWLEQRLGGGQVETHCYTPKFVEDEEMVHTKRLTYLAEQIEKAQKGISDCNSQLRVINTYRNEIQELYKAEVLTKKARFEFELNESLQGLFNFCDGLREGV